MQPKSKHVFGTRGPNTEFKFGPNWNPSFGQSGLNSEVSSGDDDGDVKDDVSDFVMVSAILASGSKARLPRVSKILLQTRYCTVCNVNPATSRRRIAETYASGSMVTGDPRSID